MKRRFRLKPAKEFGKKTPYGYVGGWETVEEPVPGLLESITWKPIFSVPFERKLKRGEGIGWAMQIGFAYPTSGYAERFKKPNGFFFLSSYPEGFPWFANGGPICDSLEEIQAFIKQRDIPVVNPNFQSSILSQKEYREIHEIVDNSPCLVA